MAKVSVIMCVYNGAERINNSIKSIINQSYTNWELIVCDDASTDNTYIKLLEFTKRDSRIKVLKNQNNMGPAYSRNKCIGYANGDYIAIMDDDDYSYIDRLEMQVAFLEDNPDFQFCSSAIDYYDGEKTISKKNKLQDSPKAKDLLWGICFNHPATMFLTDALKNVDCYRTDNEVRHIAEDYDLFLRMYAKGMKGYIIKKPLLRYYVNIEAMKKKRKYKYRIDEAIVRYKGFKSLGLLPKYFLYVIKPCLVGLLPHSLIYRIHRVF